MIQSEIYPNLLNIVFLGSNSKHTLSIRKASPFLPVHVEEYMHQLELCNRVPNILTPQHPRLHPLIFLGCKICWSLDRKKGSIEKKIKH